MAREGTTDVDSERGRRMRGETVCNYCLLSEIFQHATHPRNLLGGCTF